MKFILAPNENELRVVPIDKFNVTFEGDWKWVKTLFNFGHKYFLFCWSFEFIHDQL